jgi:hypothetical protein
MVCVVLSKPIYEMRAGWMLAKSATPSGAFRARSREHFTRSREHLKNALALSRRQSMP